MIPLHIDRVLKANRIQLDELKEKLLAEYVRLLLDWNSRVNLISRRDPENIWESHILHSLATLCVLEIPPNTSLLDLGSGGGLPGIPLAIIRGDLSITLLDSIQKKVRAVEDILKKLGLSQVRTVCARAEEAGGRLAGTFDAVIARAVAPLADLVRWSRPFLNGRRGEVTRDRRSGKEDQFSFPYLLALKGGDLEKEIQGVHLKGSRLSITEINLIFPGSELFDLVDKKLVVVQYPRI